MVPPSSGGNLTLGTQSAILCSNPKRKFGNGRFLPRTGVCSIVDPSVCTASFSSSITSELRWVSFETIHLRRQPSQSKPFSQERLVLREPKV